MIECESTQVDDIIHLFFIASIEKNCDNLLSLGQGRNVNLEKADGTFNCEHLIFVEYSIQFNDPSLILEYPPNAKFLSRYHLLNPNNPEQIEVKRNYKFHQKTFENTLKQYNAAYTKW